MKLLLDTHFVLWALDDLAHGLSEDDPFMAAMAEAELFASTVSIWEADIKSRIGKLHLKQGVRQWPEMLEAKNVEVLPLSPGHVLSQIGPEPVHRDPFDRILLCVAARENCRLLTRDRKLQSHPLAWQPFPR